MAREYFSVRKRDKAERKTRRVKVVLIIISREKKKNIRYLTLEIYEVMDDRKG